MLEFIKQSKKRKLYCILGILYPVSYTHLNGVYANENSHMLQEILVDEWGFAGFVVSDWGGSNEMCIRDRCKCDRMTPL